MYKSSTQRRRRQKTTTLPPLNFTPQVSVQKENNHIRAETSDKTSSHLPHTRSSQFFTFDKAKRLRTTLAPTDILKKIHARKKNLEEDLNNNEVIQRVAQAYGLSPRQLRKFRRKFQKIDLSASGSITRNELFEALDETQTAITDAFFELMNSAGSGYIELEDFIKVCSTYCVYSRRDILKFCFECFDTDASGFIDENEYKRMCTSVHNGLLSYPGKVVLMILMGQ